MNVDAKNADRREFLRAVPAAAVVGFTLVNASMFSPSAARWRRREQGAESRCLSAEAFRSLARRNCGRPKALDAEPGQQQSCAGEDLYGDADHGEGRKAQRSSSGTRAAITFFRFSMGRQFTNWAGRRKARTARPGRMACAGVRRSTTLTLKKGDMLVVPRGTPHKRSTAGSGDILLISPQGRS